MTCKNTMFLVRHAATMKSANMRSREWSLSEEGREAARTLCHALSSQGIERVITSDEQKARETGEIFSQGLCVPLSEQAGLHEHERASVPLLASEAEFRAHIREAFARPDELVFGDESIEGARRRFAQNIDNVLAAHPGQCLAVVAHGTVMAAFLAQTNGFNSYTLWLKLGLPCAFRVSLPSFVLESAWGAEL